MICIVLTFVVGIAFIRVYGEVEFWYVSNSTELSMY